MGTILDAIIGMPWLWSIALALVVLAILYALAQAGGRQVRRDLPDDKTKWGPR